MAPNEQVYISVAFLEVTERGTYLVRSNSGIRGFVEPYDGQKPPEKGKHLQVKVFGYNGINGHGPTTFFGSVRPPRGLKEAVGV